MDAEQPVGIVTWNGRTNETGRGWPPGSTTLVIESNGRAAGASSWSDRVKGPSAPRFAAGSRRFGGGLGRAFAAVRRGLPDGNGPGHERPADLKDGTRVRAAGSRRGVRGDCRRRQRPVLEPGGDEQLPGPSSSWPMLKGRRSGQETLAFVRPVLGEWERRRWGSGCRTFRRVPWTSFRGERPWHGHAPTRPWSAWPTPSRWAGFSWGSRERPSGRSSTPNTPRRWRWTRGLFPGPAEPFSWGAGVVNAGTALTYDDASVSLPLAFPVRRGLRLPLGNPRSRGQLLFAGQINLPNDG